MTPKIIEIRIHNNIYRVYCEEGKEGYLLHLVKRLNDLVSSISNNAHGKSSDTINFLLAALTLDDKVLELTNRLDVLTKELQHYKNKKNAEFVELLGMINHLISSLKNIKN